MRNLILATSTAIAVSTSAIAGNPAPAPNTDVTATSPMAASSAIWDGFYAGGTVGSVGGNLDFINPDFLGFELLDETTYGAFAGYN